MATVEAVNAAVKEAYDAGLCVFPPQEDGTKRPLGNWEEAQHQRPTLEELREYYTTPRQGLGIVCGTISGELEALDFDDRAIYHRFKAAASLAGLDELVEKVEAGYLEFTPNGVHWFWRTDKAGGNTKLAVRQTGEFQFKTLIETRGTGGYCIIAPSHGAVNLDGEYTRMAGCFADIPFIDQMDRDALLQVARNLDECEKTEGGVRIPKSTGPIGDRPGDDFDARADWHEDVLLPAEWSFVVAMGAQEYWRRPGKDHAHSAVLHTDTDIFVPFSSSTPFPVTEVGYGKFRTYAWLHHDGDFAAAARAVKRLGYGADPEPQRHVPPPEHGVLVYVRDLEGLVVPQMESLPCLGRDGFLMKQGSHLLYGKPKVGKTELIARLVEGWQEQGLRTVLFVEEPVSFWKIRFERCGRPWPFWGDTAIADAEDWGVGPILNAIPDGYDILVLDTLRNTVNFRESKLDEDVHRILGPLKHAVKERGMTLVAGWHKRKMPGEDGDDISGHTSLLGKFDRSLRVERVTGDETGRKRRIHLEGRLIDPTAPRDMTYTMRDDSTLEVLDVETVLTISRLEPARACQGCGAQFQPKRPTNRYCSNPCRKKAWGERTDRLESPTDGEEC